MGELDRLLRLSRAGGSCYLALHRGPADRARAGNYRAAGRVHPCTAGREPGASGGRVIEAIMIPLSSIQRTAETLMAKAAIEIPEDYLAGLRQCANTEKGDLSAFVIKAMLENYEAAKE